MARHPRSKLGGLCQYAALLAAECVLRALPLRWAAVLGRAAGAAYYRLGGRRRQIALENLRLAYGEGLPEAERCRIARESFRQTGQSLVELIWLRGRLTPRRIERLVVMEGFEKIDAALAGGRGLLLVTGHLGNWELAGQVLPMRVGPTFAVARPLRNLWLDRRLVRVREQHGQHIIDRAGALKEIVTALRDNHMVILLIDQHAHEGGIPVAFFGRDAWTTTAPAAIALRLGCPVALGYSHRDADGVRQHIVIDEVVEFSQQGDRQDDIRRATTYLTGQIERFVRRHPEQWFWLHRRWKHGPLVHPKGARVERYT